MIDKSLGFKLCWFNFHVGLSSFFFIVYICVFFSMLLSYGIDIVRVRNSV